MLSIAQHEILYVRHRWIHASLIPNSEGRRIDGKSTFPYGELMKITIDIPELLYKEAKIRAIETGQTLRQIVLTSLTKELEPSSPVPEAGQSFMDRRKLLPAYEAALKAGAFSGGTDSTQIISEDRSSREDALL